MADSDSLKGRGEKIKRAQKAMMHHDEIVLILIKIIRKRIRATHEQKNVVLTLKSEF